MFKLNVLFREKLQKRTRRLFCFVVTLVVPTLNQPLIISVFITLQTKRFQSDRRGKTKINPVLFEPRNYMNDSLRTDIFLRYSSENIVCACIYLAARELKISLPQNPPWFTIFGSDEESIKEVCVRIMHIYSHKVQSQEVLEKKINQINEQINEEKRRQKEERAKATAINVAAAITNSAQDQKKADIGKEDTSGEPKTVPAPNSDSRFKSKLDPDRKYPHQHRSSFNTPPDHGIPVLSSQAHPYYHNPGVLPSNPMARHASFPHYMNYQQHPYVNGNGTGYPPGDHYQNENYYDLNIRRNKSSNDLITSSSYKDIE